jgi:hypothetical protein
MVKSFVPAISLLLFSVGAYANGSVTGAKVTGVYCGIFQKSNDTKTEMCSVYFDKKITGSPTLNSPTNCSKAFVGESYYRFQFKPDNIGKTILAVALSAQASGALVIADGMGECSVWPDTEDISSLFIQPPAYPNFP